MKIIVLADNVNINPKQLKLEVTNKDYKTLLDLQYAGGFLRFHIDLYDENKERKASQLDLLLPFLHEVFVNKELINSYFKK